MHLLHSDAHPAHPGPGLRLPWPAPHSRKEATWAAAGAVARGHVTFRMRMPGEAMASCCVPDPDLVAALQALPERSRDLIVLADISGLSYQQIAELTGAEAHTVAARLHWARRRLRGLLTRRARRAHRYRWADRARRTMAWACTPARLARRRDASYCASLRALASRPGVCAAALLLAAAAAGWLGSMVLADTALAGMAPPSSPRPARQVPTVRAGEAVMLAGRIVNPPRSATRLLPLSALGPGCGLQHWAAGGPFRASGAGRARRLRDARRGGG